MVSASERPSRLLAALPGAVASVSSRLSTAALLGLALAALLPHRAPPAVVPPPVAEKETATAKPVESVTLVPSPVIAKAPEALLQPPASVDKPGRAKMLQFVARRLRARRTPQSDSGAFGKGGTDALALRTPVVPAEPKTPGPQAETPAPDVWSDAEIITALRECLRRLAPLGAEVEVAMPLKQERCGAPAPVLLKRFGAGSNRLEFQPPTMLNCAMVASLYTWVEKTLQPAALELLGSPIVRIRNASGYACRNRIGTVFHSGRLSEHALANAIDISGFVTADGRTIDVLSKWGPTARELREQQERAAEAAERAKTAARQAEKEAQEAARAAARAPKGAKRDQAKAEAERKKGEAQHKREEADRLEAERRKSLLRTADLQKLGRGSDAKAIPVAGPASKEEDRKTAEAAFLRRLHRGACGTFGTVLGPDANEAHRNHFHFDLAPRRRNAFCE